MLASFLLGKISESIMTLVIILGTYSLRFKATIPAFQAVFQVHFFSTPGLNPFLLSIRLRERWDENEGREANGEGRRVNELLFVLSAL